MTQILESYIGEIVAGLLSLVAVGVSLYRAQAVETQAEAAAISELASSSSDLRERVNLLERLNNRKTQEIDNLRKQAAQIPVLEAQVQFLTKELARVQEEANAMRSEFIRELETKQQEIDRLKGSATND